MIAIRQGRLNQMHTGMIQRTVPVLFGMIESLPRVNRSECGSVRRPGGDQGRQEDVPEAIDAGGVEEVVCEVELE